MILCGYGLVRVAWKEKSFVWETVSPETQSIDSFKLHALQEILASRGTKGFLVIRHDRVICEGYSSGYGPTQKHYTAGLAGSLVGGLSTLIALMDRRIKLDDRAWKYIPGWKDDPLRSRITIRHLATHSSGIEPAETDGKSHEELTGWKAAFWKRGPELFGIALNEAPVVSLPGTKFAYSAPGSAALAYAITASLKDGPQRDIRTLLKERIMEPLGVPESEWSIGYGEAHEMDGTKLYAIWGGGAYSTRAVARVGQLILQKGRWGDRQLLDSVWLEKTLSYAGTPLPDRSSGDPVPGPGIGWRTNFDGVWPSVPRDAVIGAGAGNQILLVIPSRDLVVVRFGESLGDASEGEGSWRGIQKYLLIPLMDAVVPSHQTKRSSPEVG